MQVGQSQAKQVPFTGSPCAFSFAGASGSTSADIYKCSCPNVLVRYRPSPKPILPFFHADIYKDDTRGQPPREIRQLIERSESRKGAPTQLVKLSL